MPHRITLVGSLLAVVLVLLTAVRSYSAPLSAPLSAPGQSPFGVNSHIGSRHGDLSRMDDALNQLATANPGWAREEFQWTLVTNGRRDSTYNWDMLDKVVDTLHDRGVHIVGLLNDDPNAGPPRSPEQLEGFAAFAEAAARRYGDRIRHWEVWNEPENFLYWGGLPNAAEYTRLLITVSERIKRVDGGLKVLNGGMVPTHIDYLREMHQHGAWSHFDILALHPYVDPFTPETGQIGDGGDLSKIQMLNAQFGAKPIWATEYGWATGRSDRAPNQPVDPDTQANYLVRGAALMRAAGVERIIWYKFKDENAGHDEYGIFGHGSDRTDFSQPKPAYNAFATLNQQLAGMDAATALPIGQQSVVLNFETRSNWQSGDPNRGTLVESTARARTGNSSGALTYNFTSAGNDFVGLNLPNAIPIPGSPSQLGVWVSGNGSGHELIAALRDSQGEILKFRLGVIGAGDTWRFLSTPINGTVEEWRCEGGCINRRLDFPVTLIALLLEDNPDPETGSGTFYIDDLTAMNSAQGVRFNQPSSTNVDVLWSVQDGQDVTIPTNSATGTLVDRWGNASTIAASNGQFTVRLGNSPVYLQHAGRDLDDGPTVAAEPTPTPETPRDPTPSVAPTPSAGARPNVTGPGTPVPPCQFFAETGHQVCGRLLEYWRQNDGLRVFGYPITDQREELIENQKYQVQWFQRNRLELHPENPPPYDVLLGRLGAEGLGRTNHSTTPPRAMRRPCYRIPTAGYDVCEPFLSAWRANGLELDGRPGILENESLALFGLPLTEPRTEVLADGREYTVQWFERARFEWHVENQPPYNVLYGLLGNEVEP